MMSAGSERRGRSLTELLVALAIIALIASLIIPAVIMVLRAV
jgi:prepilin-type N-terminal cleavage/methylation domain-containing protein